MPMGSSSGRSAGNREGLGAVRRATPRERAGIDPPAGPEHVVFDETPRYVLTPRGEKAMTLGFVLMYVGMIAAGIFLVGVWFGVWLA